MPQVRYNTKINQPFNLTTADKKLISNNEPKESDDWTKTMFKDLKERIKNHYSIVQDDFCPYCGTKIAYDGYGEPIEHIVAKSENPAWMFEPMNLALSCYECNTKKSIKTVIVDGCVSGTVYPGDSTCIKIIHPHYDLYLDHIEIINDIFIKARNDHKGWNTIEICGLLRLGLPMKKAHSLNIESSAEAKAMESIRDVNTPTYLKQHCQETVDRIIERYIQRTILGVVT